jgi:hypothetical protein
MVTVREVVKLWKCSPALVYALVVQGDLECYRFGLGRGTIRFTEQQPADYLYRARSQDAPEEEEEPLRHRR